VASIDGLEKGQEKTVRFPARGETSFSFRVRFFDGSGLTSEQRYAESGYRFQATIRESAIDMTLQLPAYPLPTK
jgi:hypothetical protein